MPKRIRRDHPNYELRHARVRVARTPKDYCILCKDGCVMATERYALTSSTRLVVCCMHFDSTDIVETDK